MNLFYMNEISKNNYDMESIDRSLDTIKVNNFLKSLDSYSHKFYNEIIKHTQYINFETLKTELRKCIKQISYEYYNVLFNIKNKIGSEHWLTVLCWDLLKDKCIKIINTVDDIDNDYPIIIIDDCIYSGCHMCSLIDNLTYGTNIKNKFICIVAYANKTGTKQLIKDFNVELIVGNYINGINIMLELIEYMNDDILIENFDVETLHVIPIYFDHKIANNFGSFPKLYSKIVKILPSRYQIEKLKDDIRK